MAVAETPVLFLLSVANLNRSESYELLTAHTHRSVTACLCELVHTQTIGATARPPLTSGTNAHNTDRILIQPAIQAQWPSPVKSKSGTVAARRV
jgi:hypothetical protein